MKRSTSAPRDYVMTLFRRCGWLHVLEYKYLLGGPYNHEEELRSKFHISSTSITNHSAWRTRNLSRTKSSSSLAPGRVLEKALLDTWPPAEPFYPSQTFQRRRWMPLHRVFGTSFPTLWPFRRSLTCEFPPPSRDGLI